jgi:hypothetical protein
MPAPGIKLFNITSGNMDTSWFESACFQLGPDEIVTIPDFTSPLPYVTYAKVGDQMSNPSLWHNSYHMLCFTKGGYDIGGEDYIAPSVSLVEPLSPTGEASPHKGGVVEFAFFATGLGAAPFFENYEDPRVVALKSEMPEAIPDIEPPAVGDDPGKVFHLNRDKVRIDLPGVALFPCSVSDAGFGLSTTPADPAPYFALVEIDPGATIPPHSYSQWAGLTVFDGSADIGGDHVDETQFVLVEPESTLSIKAGPTGAKLLAFFTSTAGAIPSFVNPADRFAIAVTEMRKDNGCVL